MCNSEKHVLLDCLKQNYLYHQSALHQSSNHISILFKILSWLCIATALNLNSSQCYGSLRTAQPYKLNFPSHHLLSIAPELFNISGQMLILYLKFPLLLHLQYLEGPICLLPFSCIFHILGGFLDPPTPRDSFPPTLFTIRCPYFRW